VRHHFVFAKTAIRKAGVRWRLYGHESRYPV
jgi:hypothetical protein